MAKLFVLTLCIAVVGVFAEPPSNYLPPQARNQGPSSSYGAPSQPDSRYGAPGRSAPSGRYNAPDPATRFSQQSSSRSSSYNSLNNNQFGGASQRNGFGARSNGQPSQQYGAPNGYDNGQGQGRRNNGFNARQSAPAQQYNAPAQQYNAPAQRNNAPAQRYNAPAQQYNAPAQQYNAPAQRYNAPAQQYNAPAQQYGPPSGRNQPSSEYGAPFGKKMDDDLAEPANYEYNYEVQALEESGPEFGHQESREEDSARGSYHVLLPDGRMQIVEYEADEEGYRPNIRYEETGAYPDARDNQGPY